MLWIALVIGAAVGWVALSNIVGAIVGGIVGVAVAFILQAAYGFSVMHTSRQSVPVDLAAPVPPALTAEVYELLPLSARNAAIARAAARSTGRSPELVASVLPELMGRSRVSNLATQQVARDLEASLDRSLLPDDDVDAILVGEVDLAVRSCLPPNDRIRTIVERNIGGAVTEAVMRTEILATRLPRIDRSIQDLVAEAKAARTDLPMVVGAIRKVGEYHAREMAKIR